MLKNKKQLSLATSATTQSAQSLVFIDAAVADRDCLLAGIMGNPEVVILGAERDGLVQIDEVVKRRLDIAACTLYPMARREA